jgi:hypothetical protein
MSITEDCIYCKDRGLCSRIQKRIDEIDKDIETGKNVTMIKILKCVKVELEGLLPPKGDSRREKPEGLKSSGGGLNLK